jgi:hypothetical protein
MHRHGAVPRLNRLLESVSTAVPGRDPTDIATDLAMLSF